ncbi:MAG TPA: fimbrillin family protein [Candidatus Alistipes intestinipullorum]|nr:fimbrillin family protein [Candidatus Alistipes intestinipullorum]
MRRYTGVSGVSLLAALTCIACQTSDGFADGQKGETSKLAISASVEGSGTRADDEDYYKHNQFIKDRSVIRVVNTVNYATPDFTDGAGYYEYIYTTEGIAWEDDLPNFMPLKAGTGFGDPERVDENGGFDWDMIVPTSNAFIFEAACYPMKYQHFDRITTDQSSEENFWSADLLLAHTRKSLSERYELLKLKFWHVFSMIRVELKLPIAAADEDSGFPEGSDDNRTVQKITLSGMYVTYTTRYAESIVNYGRRTVVGSSDGGRQDISMYRLPGKDAITEEGGQRYLNCMFAAIVPTQQIRTQETLLELDINTIVGFDSETMGNQIVEKKTYVFQPSVPIDMTQGNITVLRLTTDSETSSTLLLSAEVEPWDESYTDIDLTPQPAASE